MFKNYLKIALRNLLRHKGNSLINLTGLAVGIACCILIFLYVRNELAVNTCFEEVDRLYRVDSAWREPSMGLPVVTLAPVGPTLLREYPEIVDQARTYLITATVHVGKDNYRREAMVTDPSVVRMFNFPFVHGDPNTALDNPRAVIITERLAETFFGTTEVLGKAIRFEVWGGGERDYIITGVMKKLPYNSVTYFANEEYELIIPMGDHGDFLTLERQTSWQNRYLMTFVKLAPTVTPERIHAKIADFVKAFAPEEFHGNLQLEFRPLHTLCMEENNGLVRRMVLLLSGVAILILLIAAINFMNLSTARSLYRTGEIGLRKVIGARRQQLVWQFLGESVLLCFLATIIGVTLAEFSLPAFNLLVGEKLELHYFHDEVTFLSLLGIALLTGLLAGSYPAFFLSSFNPARALRGRLRFGFSNLWLRHGLVGVQFAIAVVLLIAVHTISKQVKYITQKNLGFNAEDILVIKSVPREWTETGVAKMATAKARLNNVSGVASISLSYDTPSGIEGNSNNSQLFRLPGAGEGQLISLVSYVVDESYLQTYDLKLNEGHFFSNDRLADDEGIVLNAAAVRALGWKSAVGKMLIHQAGVRFPIIGVVEDFNFQSLHQAIRPLVFFSVKQYHSYRCFSLRLSTPDLSGTVANIQKAWREIFPSAPFEYYFVDAQIERSYRTEQQIRQVVGIASALALMIACMGVLGLTALSVVQRTKEIGIRKVLGASVMNIVFLLSKQFTKPVLVAIAAAAPVAYFAMNRWLQDFTYRIDLGWWIFALAGGLALLIALLTVSTQAIKAALANPVEALRYE